MNTQEAKKIPIVSYLAKLGYNPAKPVRNNVYWYLSPLSEEKTPSFKVDAGKNLWHDFGDGIGGTLIDLGIRLHRCSISEFLKELESNKNSLPIFKQPSRLSAEDEKQNKVSILEIKNLESEWLTDYLLSRRITLELARVFCKEVVFSLRDRKYMAIGFQNNSGGFELRNPSFKSSSSPKDVTLQRVGTPTKNLTVTEGFMDYLSLRELQLAPSSTDHLILNSASFATKGIEIMKAYEHVHLFLDNDHKGKEVSQRIIKESGLKVTDHSKLYTGHDDLNAYHVSLGQQQQDLDKVKKLGR
jgi:DNA primase